MILSNFLKELMEENNDLRELLQLTERELVLLLNDHQGDVLTESGVWYQIQKNFCC